MIHLPIAAALSPFQAAFNWARDEWKRRRRWTAQDIAHFIETGRKNNLDKLKIGDIELSYRGGNGRFREIEPNGKPRQGGILKND